MSHYTLSQEYIFRYNIVLNAINGGYLYTAIRELGILIVIFDLMVSEVDRFIFKTEV